MIKKDLSDLYALLSELYMNFKCHYEDFSETCHPINQELNYDQII